MKIRAMAREEVDWAVDLAAAEGWNPGLADADAFYAQDPGAFLIGELDGARIGCISAVKYQGAFGFIGFYIVTPEHRGKGHGIQLWNAAMDRLANRLIGLDGVFAQQDNYQKSGFNFAYRNIRYEYAAQAQGRIVDAAENVDLEKLLPFDFQHFAFPRPAFLRAWLGMPNARHCILKDAQGNINAFGLIRTCRKGWKIGPLFADNAALAEECFQKLITHVPPDHAAYLDVPEVNTEGIALAKRHAMNEVFGTARMYNGAAPKLPTAKIFGVTTFELG